VVLEVLLAFVQLTKKFPYAEVQHVYPTFVTRRISHVQRCKIFLDILVLPILIKCLQ